MDPLGSASIASFDLERSGDVPTDATRRRLDGRSSAYWESCVLMLKLSSSDRRRLVVAVDPSDVRISAA